MTKAAITTSSERVEVGPYIQSDDQKQTAEQKACVNTKNTTTRSIEGGVHRVTYIFKYESSNLRAVWFGFYI